MTSKSSRFSMPSATRGATMASLALAALLRLDGCSDDEDHPDSQGAEPAAGEPRLRE